MSNTSSELENWSYSLMSLYGQLSKLSRSQDSDNEKAIAKLLSLLSPAQCEDCLPSLYVQHYFTLTKEDAQMVFGAQYNTKGTILPNSSK